MYPYINEKYRSGQDLEENVNTNREDVLTAMVFGAMRYMPHQEFLYPFLQELGIPSESPTDDCARIRFWPRLTEEGAEQEQDRLYVEPDWQITMSGSNIIGESKLGAPLQKSQLQPEWNYARENTHLEQELYLVAVTPRIQDRDVVKRNDRWFWISWQRISLLLQEQIPTQGPPQKHLTEDLVQSLEQFGISPLHILSEQGRVPPMSESVFPLAEARARRRHNTTLSSSLESLDDLPDVPPMSFFNPLSAQT